MIQSKRDPVHNTSVTETLSGARVRMYTKHSNLTRKADGQAIAEFGVGLLILLMVVIGGSLLLLNALAVSSYHSKLHLAVQSAAERVSHNQRYWLGFLQSSSSESYTDAVISSAKQMGLPTLRSQDISVSYINYGTERMAIVTATARRLPMLCGFPPVTVSETGVASIVRNYPDTVHAFSLTGFTLNSAGILVPGYYKKPIFPTGESPPLTEIFVSAYGNPSPYKFY